MTIQTIHPLQAHEKIQQGACFIDIRSLAEFRREHIEGAELCALPDLTSTGLSQQANAARCIIFHCQSGMRTNSAQAILRTACPDKEIYILKDGINGWKKAQLPITTDTSQPIDIMRQVQIAAGSLVLCGIILGFLVHTAFFALSAFVGAGLVFAGISGFCGMARLLAAMPWNKIKP